MSDPQSNDDPDSDDKVAQIFRELVGDRVSRLDGSHHNFDSVAAIAKALAPSSHHNSAPDEQAAHDIAFHLIDWNADAAFIVAIQLFPERFTEEEIRTGVGRFLIHAPNHVAAAAALSGHPIEDIFEVGALRGPDDDLEQTSGGN